MNFGQNNKIVFSLLTKEGNSDNIGRSDVTVNNSRLQVKETNWEGDFNEDGTFKAGKVYTVIYKINFKNYKDVVNYRIKPAANKSTLNGNLAEITFKDGIENATLKYTFPALTGQGI